jgi:hypothetical protein
MLLAFVVFLAALAVMVVIFADYGRRHLSISVAPAQSFAARNAARLRLPWVTALLIATPFYLAAMYLASTTYNPRISRFVLAGVTDEKKTIQRPYQQLLDSSFAVVVHDPYFQDEADLTDQKRSDVRLYEDDKLLGPAHSSHYEIAVLGMGRYSHWKGNYSIFAFSSSDNTDPNTNGRVYSAARPPEK